MRCIYERSVPENRLQGKAFCDNAAHEECHEAKIWQLGSN
jgi:hypothetical protein